MIIIVQSCSLQSKSKHAWETAIKFCNPRQTCHKKVTLEIGNWAEAAVSITYISFQVTDTEASSLSER